jgi:PAS domain S-box-containing protein
MHGAAAVTLARPMLPSVCGLHADPAGACAAVSGSTFVMTETVFSELRRYVCFDAADEASLHAFAPVAARQFDRIVEDFYRHVAEHDEAARVFTDSEQIARDKQSLHAWLQELFAGPWDDAYCERRLRIGHVHVQIALPQRFMFGAMNLIRSALADVAQRDCQEPERGEVRRAIDKLLDIELAIMLESYREAYVDQIQQDERVARTDLQRRLATSEARHEEIVEKAEALITTMDRDGRVSLFNAKCERTTGLSRSSVHGASWLALFVPPEDHDSVRARIEQALSGRSAAAYEGALPSVASGECRVRWQFTKLPDGASPAVCAIGIDMSTEHQLGIRTRRAERLAALGTMAAGFAHEIRNPLNAAHLQLSVAERRLQRPDIDLKATKAAVSAAAREMERLGALVQDFLQFARPQALRVERIDLRRTLESSLQRLVREAESRGVALQLQPGEAATLEADAEKLQVVVLNLVRNAIEAAGTGGRVELSVATSGPYTELVVRDDGPGVGSDLPIFEPFFTTKEAGTGLGLAIVHRIVMDHGGQVAVQSVPGDTRFTVSLPRTQGS